MFNRDELKTVTAAVTPADAQVGTVVPNNMRRFIYRVKFLSTLNGANVLTIGKRENGAGATTVIDRVATVVLNESEVDPDELHEDSAPIYIIDGPASNPSANPAIVPVGTSTLWCQLSVGGTGFATFWFIDAPA